MVVDRFEDLDAWQVADELRVEVYALTATGPASKDFKFCNQIRDRRILCHTQYLGRLRPLLIPAILHASWISAFASVMEIRTASATAFFARYFTDDRFARLNHFLLAHCKYPKA